MSVYSLTHVGDRELARDLATVVAQERGVTATVLAHIAEFDARKLYLPAAYPSTYAYCVGELHLSEDAAYKRIQAARAARQFPAIFDAVADGRLHLSAVGLLAPYLTEENAADLLAAAAHRTKSEIEELLAQRFPRSEAMALVQALPASLPQGEAQLAPGQVEARGPEGLGACAGELAPGQVEPRSKVAPVAPERFLFQFTAGRSAHDLLRYAQGLLGHAVPAGDIGQVFERALKALVEQLERRKFAASTRPRQSVRSSANPRHIPAHVKRAVWERDGGRCTFVSEAGKRCEACTRLEFDHIEAVARGGRATVVGIRLRCRPHNQYAAECTFGTAFMDHKRRQAQRARAQGQTAGADSSKDVVPWLRQLGFRADEARRAAERCEAIPDASLEERLRFALSLLAPPCRRVGPSPGTAT